jgi:hypothetical protein
VNRLRSLERWDRGFESHSRNGCLYSECLFCVSVVLCVGRGLATGWSPVQGVLSTVYRIKKLEKSVQGPIKGCRAIIIIHNFKGLSRNSACYCGNEPRLSTANASTFLRSVNLGYIIQQWETERLRYVKYRDFSWEFRHVDRWTKNWKTVATNWFCLLRQFWQACAPFAACYTYSSTLKSKQYFTPKHRKTSIRLHGTKSGKTSWSNVWELQLL